MKTYTTTDINGCDHKFVDSKKCLKCGIPFDVLRFHMRLTVVGFEHGFIATDINAVWDANPEAATKAAMAGADPLEELREWCRND